jgi:pantoate--beta-alanine ligase
MRIFETSTELHSFINAQKKLGKTVGFVPTMGALHQGHVSLVESAKKECDIVVCSIFVNPTQFNNAEDLSKYPRTVDADRQKLEFANCDILFFPSVKEIYPQSTDNINPIPLGHVLHVLEGEFRPGHFEGMMQVVEILLRKVEPDILYMGLKDYQQYLIVCKMVDYLKLSVLVKGMPTVRENDGLAMSSRNVRLSSEGRTKALSIFKALQFVKENIGNSSTSELENQGRTIIQNESAGEIEYFAIVDKSSLLPPAPNQLENLIILTAVWIDGVRLIDNVEV